MIRPRPGVLAAALLAAPAVQAGMNLGPWTGLQSYEESVNIENVQSDWQAPAFGLSLDADTRPAGGFVLGGRLNAGSSLQDTEEWISRGQTLQLNDMSLRQLSARVGVDRPLDTGDAMLTPGLLAEYRYLAFERSHFLSRATGLEGQAGTVDEEVRLAFAGPSLRVEREVAPGTRVTSRLACQWMLDGRVHNSLFGSDLAADRGRLTTLELSLLRQENPDAPLWTFSVMVEHQSLKGSASQRLIPGRRGEPVYEYVEWPDNVLDTVAFQLSRGIRF